MHLPEMRERTATALVMSSGWEQTKNTFYLHQFPARLFPYSTTCYIKTLEQDAPNHSRKQRIGVVGVIFILEVHRDFSLSISPPPGTPWPPIVQCHVQLWVAGTTACIGQTELEGGEGRGGEKVPLPFITRTVGLWTQLPLRRITYTHPTT